VIIDSPYSAGRYDIGDEVAEMPGVASAGVEARVEDGDLEAARAAGVQEAAENLSGLWSSPYRVPRRKPW
jgi:hypothetical protein